MDFKKLFLIAGLVISGYFMIFTWNNDYNNVNIPQSSKNIADSLPSGKGINDDVPDVSRAQLPDDSAETDNDLINVTTDVLKLTINLQGADIVNLQLLNYPLAKNTTIPLSILDKNASHVYIAQQGLIGAKAPDSTAQRAIWKSASKDYKLTKDTLEVPLFYEQDGIKYTKTFVFSRGFIAGCTDAQYLENKLSCIDFKGYNIKVKHNIENTTNDSWHGNFFAQLKRDNLPDSSVGSPTTSTYLGAAMWTPDEPYKKVTMDDLDKGKVQNNIQIKGGWVAWLQHYFVAAWIPEQNSQNNIRLLKDSQNNYIVGFISDTLTVNASQNLEVSANLYVGPKNQDYLSSLSQGLELTVDYGFLWFIAQPIFWLLKTIYNFTNNWGWSIIILTCIVKLAFFPLSAASYKSMAKLKSLAPKMQEIKDKYGDDKQKASQATMELYQKEKVNPLGGCLPILIQMPVFISLYWVLLESVEMRQASWMFWIQDLSVQDPYFVLPLIMGVSMFVQQKLNPAPADPVQAKVMSWIPIIFTVFFLWFPAGLVLYWVVNNLISITQQWYITNHLIKP